jgi:uncharacterized protein YndB with AHSA1/START domain
MARIIERRLEFDEPPERVWRAITDPTEIASWFGDSAELDLIPGGAGRFGWDKHGSFAVRVEEVDPPIRLAWSWAKEPDVGIDVGVSTLVEWVLTKRPDGGTILDLTESGFVEEKHLEDNTGGWQAELIDLVDLIESGT